MRISEWPVLPCMVSISRTSFQPSWGRSTMNAVLAACGYVGVVLGAADEDGEVGPVGLRDEPLAAVDHPLVAVGVRTGLYQRGIGAGDLGLGHGEARSGRTGAQRPEVSLGLLWRRPVQQRVHVALVGRLAVEHPRPVVGLGRLGLNHGQLDVPEAHPAPLRGHVGQPQPGRSGLFAQADQGRDALGAGETLAAVASLDPVGHRSDDLLHEGAYPPPQLLHLGRQREIDGHGSELPRAGGSARARAPSGARWRCATGCPRRPVSQRSHRSERSRGRGPPPPPGGPSPRWSPCP